MSCRTLFGCAASLLLLIGLPNNAVAMKIASSDFDDGLDGWSIVGDGVLSHQPTGGNPEGFLQSIDQPTGLNTDAFAPTKFLGDWSDLDGQGYISADFKMISACCGISEGFEFFISGPGGNASRRFSTAEGPFFEWTTYSIDLVEFEWNMGGGSWDTMLENIDTLRIDMEHVGGAETTGLDNVLLVMIPEPSTLLLFCFGALGVVSLRRRRSIR